MKSLSILLTVLVVGHALTADSQAVPELMVTWKANGFAPPDYQGRVLPSGGTRVDLAVELIDAGKLADISGRQIRWVINNDIINSGAGLKTTSFTANGLKGTQAVEVTVLGYRGANVERILSIPTVRPEVAIRRTGNLLEALLYFFNIQNLSQAQFAWTVNGERPTGDASEPSLLELGLSGLPPETNITAQLQAQNKLNPLEIASRSVSFKTQ